MGGIVGARRWGACLLIAGSIALTSPAAATTMAGGGSRKTDCLAVFETSVVVPSKKRKIVCEDGDPACDVDGIADGACTFDLAVCVNAAVDPACATSGVESILVDHSADDGDPFFDPEFQGLQDRIENELGLPGAVSDCTAPALITVPVRGPFPGDLCKSGRKMVRTTTKSLFDIAARKSYVDRDAVKLMCRPAPGACDPRALFGSTFDRIQRQIFDRHCGVSACHDSQTFASDLLLETGAAYASIVGVTPANFAAAQLGWQRVVPGDETKSFLYQKILGGLGPEFGERMPRGRGKLPAFLRDIVRRWIVDGAPGTGWLVGTD